MLYQLNMNNYIIGIDGGGTKTLGVLWDSKGNEVKRIIKGFSNFNVDLARAKINLEETIEGLISGNYQVNNIIIGVSGYSGLDEPVLYENYLKEKYQANVIIRDDGFLALNAIYNPDYLPVILVISGTGSIIYGMNNNSYFRYGGYGHLLGDEGSAYYLAVESLKKIIYELDNDLALSEFSTCFMKEANFNSLSDIIKIVYHNEKSKIANYAKITYNLAKTNDDAKLLVEKTAYDLYLQIKALLRKMKVKTNCLIALKGGLLDNSIILKETLIKMLEDDEQTFILDLDNYETVNGALRIVEGDL